MNDKITSAVQELGHCCPFAYLCQKNLRKNRDTSKKMAKELGLTEKAMEYNRKKFREGKMVCLKLSICQNAKKEEIE